MSLEYDEAVDDMLTMLKTVWDPTGYQIHYEDTQTDRDISNDPWAEVVIRHAAGGQRSLGGQGNRIFERLGVMVVSINSLSSSGLSSSYNLAKVVSNAYEGVASPNGVWFRNVRINERGREGTFFKTDVVVEFEYHEIK